MSRPDGARKIDHVSAYTPGGYHGLMRRWLVMAVAFPLGAWALARAADWIEGQYGNGHSQVGHVAKAMRVPHEWRQSHR
jgi:hypothetical protein